MLGQLKASVARDRISQFLAKCAFLLVVRQLQQIEARRRRRKSTDWISASDVEEAFQHTADRVTSVLYTDRILVQYLRRGRTVCKVDCTPAGQWYFYPPLPPNTPNLRTHRLIVLISCILICTFVKIMPSFRDVRITEIGSDSFFFLN